MQPQEISAKTGSIWEALRIALPLVIAASGSAVKLFTDRIMLAHYSGEATAAGLSAGIFYFMLTAFWLGAAGYAASFVAQYTGAGRNERVGAAVWQGVFLGLLGGAMVATGYFWGDALFRWLDHAPGIQKEEVTYFTILCPFSFLFIVNQGLAGFWTGRGKMWAVTAFEMITTVINFFVNYLLIYGEPGMAEIGLAGWGWEPMGIAGAAWGTNLSGACGLALAFFFLLRKTNRQIYGTWPRRLYSSWRQNLLGLPRRLFDFPLFKRLLTFGLPSGVHFVLDIAAFNIFVQLMTSISPEIGMANSIAFGINAVAFIPMCGLGQAASIIVGQAVGARRVWLAVKAVRSCLILMLAYMAVMGSIFFFASNFLCSLFPMEDVKNIEEVRHLTKIMLRFIAGFLLFDGMYILYNSAIKGAGDTKFSMWLGVAMSWTLFAIPCYVALRFFHADVWTLWTILLVYVIIAGTVFYARYRNGKWQRMRVIED